MITSLGTHRGYKVFYQSTTDFEGIYTEPTIGLYLGQTFEESKSVLDAMLDERPEEDVPFDVELAAKLAEGERW